ncbi:MAG: PQQ-dependent sugar dehydrogenase [Bacteroidales bacterium]|nr:PQQ-dependent sugar dehydrogenase [Bacteroidales bacterium]
MKRVSLIIGIAVFAMISCNSQNEQPNGDENNAGLELPDGFKATVVAEDIGPGRHIAVNGNGDIYLQLRYDPGDGSTVALRDSDNDGKADKIEYFGDMPGTGINVYKGYLYTSTNTTVQRYKLQDGKLLPDTDPEIIVEGFPQQGQHAAKPFTFDGNGHMYVTIGGPSNACMEQTRTKGSPGQDPCPQLEWHAGIWRFDATTPGQDFKEDGYHFATGIRHAVALNWNPVVDQLYAVQHGRDQLSQFFPDMFSAEDNAQLPAEEFLLVEDGSDFGWPYCYYNQLKEKKLLAPEYGGDREKVGRCAEKDDPIMGFPGHYAPNDILFYPHDQFPEKYRNGAFIAFHGSWNRAPLEQEGYNVVFVPFNGSMPSGDWEVFADNFAGMEQVESPGDAKHRPTGLAVGPDGSLYVVDSVNGKIWRIFYSG